QLLPPILARQCAHSDREVLRRGRAIRLEERLSLPSGSVVHYETSKTPIRDPRGRTIGLLGISRDVTADRRVAEALKDSEAKYRLLVESSLAGIYIATADGIFRFANKMMGKISGWPVKKLIGRNLFEFIHSEDRKWAERVFSNRIRGRPGPEQYRIRALHRDGSIRWLEIRAARIAYQGRPAVLGNFIDITDHVRAEAGLKESEERMRSLFVAAPFALFLETLTGSIVDCNQAAVDLLGYSREELLRMSARDLVPKKVADRFPDLITRELTTGGFFVEGENIAKNGRIIPVEASSRMIEIGGKKFIIVAIADITERKQAQAALAGERDRAQTYLDVAGVILIALNHRGEVVMINKKGCEVLGWKEKEIVGRNWFQSFLPPSARAETAAVFQKIVSESLPPAEYHQNPVRTKAGEERLIAWHNTCLRDEGGKISGVLSSGEDVTDREQAETRLRDTSKLEAVGTMSLGLAHEFNNILMGISGYAQLALVAPADRERVEQALETILRQTRRGKVLI
ncbi:MAG: PAS domain S-box protein, partial [Candidatus Aureabacteria bacterium]|nr:PAS domain S-box protein [Candidatus Auribacterota bacterium]